MATPRQPEPQSQGTFQPLGGGTRRLPGAPALLAVGCTRTEWDALHALLAANTLDTYPLVAVTGDLLDRTLEALAALPDGSGADHAPATQRALVVSGFREVDLHRVMAAYRTSGLPAAQWATVTHTTLGWTMRQLLQELGRERDALRDAMRKQTGPSS